jgi:hypothetical protein
VRGKAEEGLWSRLKPDVLEGHCPSPMKEFFSLRLLALVLIFHPLKQSDAVATK